MYPSPSRKKIGLERTKYAPDRQNKSKIEYVCQIIELKDKQIIEEILPHPPQEEKGAKWTKYKFLDFLPYKFEIYSKFCLRIAQKQKTHFQPF